MTEQAKTNAAPLATHSLLTPEDCEDYKRGLARRLASWGLFPTTPDHCGVLVHRFESDKDRHDAWVHDTAHRAIVDYQAGELKYAWRGLLRAQHEVGRCGGFYPSSNLHDALVALQNALESILFQDERALAAQVKAATTEKAAERAARAAQGAA